MSLLNVLSQFLPDRLHAELQFYRYHGSRLNPANPLTFSQLLVTKKLDDRRHAQKLARLVDKFAVREFVEQRLGTEYLIPLIGVYDSPDAIDPDTLPDSFVLKATHGSGMNLIIRDKTKVDWGQLRATAASWLERDYTTIARELAYRYVPRRLIIEEFLTAADGEPPADYKFYVFSGTVRLFHIDYQRWQKHTQAFFLPDGTQLAVKREMDIAVGAVTVPERLSCLVEEATILGQGHEFVRVDLYDVSGRSYFSELTLYPAAGKVPFRPPEFDLEMGEVWRESRPVSRKWVLADDTPIGARLS